MTEKPSTTIEDYLDILYILQRDNEPIVGVRLAELLNVSAPTVTNTLKRMSRDGLVDLDDPSGIRLTKQGLDLARTVMRRHMLSEWMLTRMLNISWSHVHSEAHNMEHAVSDEIERQMQANLQDPQTCPHGNPLPGYEYVTAGWTPVTEIPKGETVVIRRIHEIAEHQADFLEFLESNGVILGTQVKIADVQKFNQTIVLEVGGRRVALGFPAARYVYAERGTM
jgi:DtxR family transcriptional regulator, Mn-dependent transcriptional regulator